MENPIKMDDLGGPPLFFETPIWLMFMVHVLLQSHGSPFESVMISSQVACLNSCSKATSWLEVVAVTYLPTGLGPYPTGLGPYPTGLGPTMGMC